jgi:nucleotide-binding universal stress UspA family protein
MDQAEPPPAVEPPKHPDRRRRADRRPPAARPGEPLQHAEQPPPDPEPWLDPGQAPYPAPDPRGQVPDPVPDHPVVAGFDGSPASRNALAYAAGMARRLERPLLVVYVTTRGIYCEPLTGQVIRTVNDREQISRWLLAELDEVCDAEGLQVHTTTRCGNPARELAATAAQYSADALVIGASGQAWHQLVGSVPGWLARHVRCPLIVVP